ncbi:MAG TPA: sporulation protein [Saprospiraceae bacterium]|nr:sporulation protein [Saprospiraceae bacterium]
MFGKVKRWLGIEGVKLELILPEEIAVEASEVEGNIRFYSMNHQTVRKIRVRMIEKYKRGRRKNKLVDEYHLGEIELVQDIDVPENEQVDIEFTLPFTIAKSDIDRFSDQNFLFKGVASAAKLLKGVHSVYRIEAEAEVKGTALNPFDTKEITLV